MWRCRFKRKSIWIKSIDVIVATGKPDVATTSLLPRFEWLLLMFLLLFEWSVVLIVSFSIMPASSYPRGSSTTRVIDWLVFDRIDVHCYKFIAKLFLISVWYFQFEMLVANLLDNKQINFWFTFLFSPSILVMHVCARVIAVMGIVLKFFWFQYLYWYN